MKPEVGMFYRYKGQIGKYKKITELDRYPSFTNNYLRENEVILLNNAKFSYNIIDILEVGDYVNGLRVNKIVDGKPIHEDYNDPFYSFGWENDDIKTVITHEQMEQMAYKVGD